MKSCPACGAENVEEAHYCELCGHALPHSVPGLPTPGHPAPAQPKQAPASGQIVTIGRDPDNDVVLDFPMVSSRHARFLIQGDDLVIEDLQTTNGTYLNHMDNRIIGRRVVHSRDSLLFGSYRVSVARLLRQTRGAHDKDQLHPLINHELTIGRTEDNDVVLSHPLIAQHHARLYRSDDQIMVEDLCGATYVNGEHIRQAPLEVGDHLMLGPFFLEYTPQGLLRKTSWRQLQLDLHDISVVVHKDKPKKRKTLLERVSLVVYPGELCALMGVAGSGKSTLIKAACGYAQPTYGHVLLNQLDLYEHYDAYRHAIGYVPQEDIFHKDLTVGQALGYAGRLRLEGDYDRLAIEQRVNETLTDLGMFEANPQIRDVRLSDISGGQRRRVNIATELLTDPSLLFLDEPTSGLSSEDALIVIELLRRMAERGKTIILSMHQPSMELYAKMDNVIYLHRGGRLVYYGPTVPDSLTFSNPDLKPSEATNPDLALRAFDGLEAAKWQQKYKASTYHREFVEARRAREAPKPVPGAGLGNRGISPLKQWWVLHCRNFRVKLNDTMNSLILLMQAPVIAALIALVFSSKAENAWKSAPTTLYLMVISSIWFGCSNAARDICSEWPIFQRERRHNLEILPYVYAKFSIGACVSLIQCAILIAIVAPYCHLQAPIWVLGLFLWITALTGVCLGLLVSAFASPLKKSNEVAVGLIPIVLLPMVIMGGIIKPYKDMNPASKVVASATVTRWSFESCLLLEAEANPATLPEASTLPKSKRALIRDRFFKAEDGGYIWRGMFVISGFGLLCLALTAIYLRSKDQV